MILAISVAYAVCTFCIELATYLIRTLLCIISRANQQVKRQTDASTDALEKCHWFVVVETVRAASPALIFGAYSMWARRIERRTVSTMPVFLQQH